MGFLVPFVFADRLNVQRDLYYGVYAVSVFGFFVLWTRATGQSIAEMRLAVAGCLRWRSDLGALHYWR